jgi:hypothetical protein
MSKWRQRLDRWATWDLFFEIFFVVALLAVGCFLYIKDGL